jgi:hypothetical protein
LKGLEVKVDDPESIRSLREEIDQLLAPIINTQSEIAQGISPDSEQGPTL